MKFLDMLTNKVVTAVRPGPTKNTICVKHVDGSTQIQFLSLLKPIS